MLPLHPKTHQQLGLLSPNTITAPAKEHGVRTHLTATHQRGYLLQHEVLPWPGGQLGGSRRTHKHLEARGSKHSTKTNLPLQPAHSSSAEVMPVAGLVAPKTSN